MVQRDKKVRMRILRDRAAPMLLPTVMKHVKPNVCIMTDEWIGYHNVTMIYASREDQTDPDCRAFPPPAATALAL